MKIIKALLFCAAASAASTAVAGWDGSSYINDTPEAVDIAFGVDATVNPYNDPENVGVNVFITVGPDQEVYCPPIALDQVNTEYAWLDIDDVVINQITPYYP